VLGQAESVADQVKRWADLARSQKCNRMDLVRLDRPFNAGTISEVFLPNELWIHAGERVEELSSRECESKTEEGSRVRLIVVSFDSLGRSAKEIVPGK
jgi:hypothetical protein